jgi:transposase, IS30 family
MKKKKYRHLVQLDRDRLEALLKSGHTQTEIAAVLKVDKSTVSRELKRNRRRKRKRKKVRLGPYEATVAEHKAYVRRKYAKFQGMKIEEGKRLRRYITRKLRQGWSPDGISGRMKTDRQSFYASKTAIYDWLRSVHGQYWCRYLESRRYYRRKRKSKKTKRVLIPHRIGLERRSRGATNRTRYGHLEGDTMLSGKKTGSKNALSVIFERKARYVDARKIKSLQPAMFAASVRDMTGDIERVKSLTLDNGIENTKYETIGIKTFFCNPYHSWEKGGVENVIGMIRRFIPKGSDLANYSDTYVKMVVDALNRKPRKSLGYKTPYEVMQQNHLFAKNKKAEVALRG